MHRFELSPDSGTAVAIDPAHTAAIRRWTREYLRLPQDSTVTVNELACRDPGCPLVETVIAVFEEGRTCKWKFTRPQVAVTKLMVQQTLASPSS
jgi:hypothetical protein